MRKNGRLELVSKNSADGVKWGVKLISDYKLLFRTTKMEHYCAFDGNGFASGNSWGDPSLGFWGSKKDAKKLLTLVRERWNVT